MDWSKAGKLAGRTDLGLVCAACGCLEGKGHAPACSGRYGNNMVPVSKAWWVGMGPTAVIWDWVDWAEAEAYHDGKNTGREGKMCND